MPPPYKITTLFSWVLLLLNGSFLSAQNFIKGTVSDSAGAPVPFCAMALMNTADSSLVKGNVTDEKGSFTFEAVKPGNYILKFSNVGFHPLWLPLPPVDSLSQLSLEPVVLKSEGINLKEISVAVFKPTIEFKKGTVVFNVENNLVATGNTVLELLKRIPGVTVDNDNNVFINGKSGVRFLIDGRLQQIPAAQVVNLLSSMTAESISTIELIKNPPAKYDAAGTAGLINIVTKKVKVKGFSGNFFNVASMGQAFRNTTTLALNYKSDKLTLFTNASFLDLNFINQFKFYRTLNNPGGQSTINEDGVEVIHKLILNAKAGFEYELSKKTSIGFNVGGGPNNSLQTPGSKISITESTFPYDYLTNNSVLTENYNAPYANFNVLHKFDSLGSQLQFSADYTNFLESESRHNRNNFYNNSDVEVMPAIGYNSIFSRNFKVFTQKLDFTKVFKKEITLEAGLKTSFVNNLADFRLERGDPVANVFYNDTNFSNIYNYREQILAGYMMLGKGFKKGNVQFGMRAEQTNIDAKNQTTGFILKRNYLNFFPSASADYSPGQKHNFQLNYSYRIDRPEYQQLNPSRLFWDQLDYKPGNPYLRPEYSHNLNLDYVFNHFFTTSIGYVRTMNGFYSFSRTNDSTKINADTIMNLGVRDNLSLTLFIQKQLVKWYNLQLSVSGSYRDFTGSLNGDNLSTTGYFVHIYMNNEFILPKEFKLQLSVYYTSPVKDGPLFYAPTSNVSLALRKSFFQGKLNLVLNVNDLFFANVFGVTTTFSTQSTYFLIYNDTRRVGLSVNYRFGKLRLQQHLKRSNEEESNRLKRAE
ncbi:MAG: TonB-dependent receptor domain-containing protein [Bacteroidia bacterium]